MEAASNKALVSHAFWGMPQAFWGLWVGTLVAWAGRMVLPFLALFFTHEAGYSAASAGLVVSLYGLGGVIAVLAGGLLIDRVGSRSVILWALALCGVVSAVMATVSDPVVIMLMVPLLGAFTQALNPAVNVLVAVVIPRGDQRRAFSLMYVARNAGFSLGPAAGGLLAQYSYHLVFVGEAIVMLAAAVICAATIPAVAVPRASGRATAGTRGGLLVALRDVTFMTVVAFNLLFTCLYTQNMSVTLPLVMSRAGYRPAQYGLLLTINGVMLVILQMPADRCLRAARQTGLLVLGVGFLGVGIAAQAWAVSWWMYAGCVVLWTIGELLNMATTATVVSHMAPPHLIGRYMSVFGAAFPIASLIAPVSGGVMLDNLGARTVMICSGGLAFLAMLGRIATARRTEARLHAENLDVSVGGPPLASEPSPGKAA